MNKIYLFTPKNPNLNHCPESFYEAFRSIGYDENHLERIESINLDTVWYILTILKTLKSGKEISVFFFSIDSLIFIAFLRMIFSITSKQLKVYYMMHEPKFDKGRIGLIKSFMVYSSNLLLGHLSDQIFLPSSEAIERAKTFIEHQKICPINLTFMSVPDKILEENFWQLQCNWENSKTFSYICRTDKDKNPQGFLSLAKIIHKQYPEKARFIRAGSDQNMSISYNEDIIVRFPGYISPKAKKFLLGLTHFVVIPYTFSTQSGVITEALSYGKLLIVNDIPAFSYLKGKNFAFFTDFNNENAIVKCIDDIMNMSIDDYKKYYREAIAYFEENHSEAYLSKSFERLF
jgi:hypothetical protein